MASAESASRSSPASSTRPAVTPMPSGSSRITAEAVMDLPDPLSPTTQSVRPGPSASDTSSSANGRSAPGGSATERPSMASATAFEGGMTSAVISAGAD